MTVNLMTAENFWPEGGLESVPNCPVCQSGDRSLLHQGLSDLVFFVAPGRWDLWQCAQCRSGWLDPRPNEATIGLAYGKYYTHEEIVGSIAEPTTSFQRLRVVLGNGYRNRRYGVQLKPAMNLGWYVAQVFPILRKAADASYRFLPQPSKRAKSVLDIGCGNGGWLKVAASAGWHIAGVEPDPVSQELAKKSGTEVRDSVESYLRQRSTFDYITISHVIEHVHDPLLLLQTAYTLLNPGGGLYIETPNIDAIGHQFYGRHWRGLEPPRHLILFNCGSLRDVVARAGFENIRFHRRADAFAFTSEQSRRIAADLDPYSVETSEDMGPAPGPTHRLRSIFTRRRAEFLTLTAIKPK